MLGTVCTTIRVCNGSPEFWLLHKERLQYFAAVLNREINLEQIESEVGLCAMQLFKGVLRVELDIHGDIQINVRTNPEVRELRWCSVFSERNQIEASIKWLDRTNWDGEREQQNVDVLVLLNGEQHYLECCIGNLFVYRPREKQWYTPELTGPILPGIMRSVLLSHAKTLGVSVMESTIAFEQTDHLWMSNAIRGLVPLNTCGSSLPRWSSFTVGKDVETKALLHFQQVLFQVLNTR